MGKFNLAKPAFNHDLKLMIPIYILQLVLGSVFSFILFLQCENHTGAFYLAMELICSYIIVYSFITVWFTFYRNNIAGFMFIGVGMLCLIFFNIFYSVSDFNFQARFTTNHDSLTYWLLHKFCWLLLILTVFLPFLRKRIDKWLLYIIVSMLSIGFAFAVSCMLDYSVEHISRHSILIYRKYKVILVLFIFAIYFYMLISIKSHVNENFDDYFSYRYIVLSVFFMIPAEILLIFNNSSKYYIVCIIGHVLKVMYHFMILRGIYLSFIDFPYIMLEEKDRYINDILYRSKVLLDCMTNYAFITDNEERITMLNKTFQKALGVSDNDVIGMKAEDFNEMIQLQINTVLQEDFYLSVYEVSFGSGDGKRIDARLNSAKVLNDCDDLIGCINILSDITEYKEEQQVFQQQEKLAFIGKIAAGIVHEIKNPLSVIKGISQLIQLKYDNDEKLMQYAESIDEASESISKLIMSILDLAKPHPSENKEFSLNNVINEILMIFKDYLSINNIILESFLCKDERTIIGDPDKIKQVMLNMLNNAVDAVDGVQNPRISIITEYITERNCMELKIIDNGRGISKENIKNIGAPFFTTKDHGTGLGLSICYQIISQLKGSIRIESEEGKGTCFIISIPCKELEDTSLYACEIRKH